MQKDQNPQEKSVESPDESAGKDTLNQAKKTLRDVAKTVAYAMPVSGLNAILYAVETRFRPKTLFRRAAIARPDANHPRLLIDVTHQVYSPQRSGIPRVVFKIANEFLALESESAVPWQFVFTRLLNGHLYSAERYRERVFGLPAGTLGRDIPIEPVAGDSFLMLGANFDRFHQLIPIYRKIRALGGVTVSVINDLLPFDRPDWFPEDFTEVFHRAIPEIVAESDVLSCVSQTTADEVTAWIHANAPERLADLTVTTFSQGADVAPASDDTSPIRPELTAFLRDAEREDAPIFTQVSIIQPRKGQDFALDVFEERWSSGQCERLIYVGRKGWKADALYERIRSHPQQGRLFLFVENANDHELALVYERSLALLSPSQGEGYGLPVVEASLLGLPVILSDIPVYRELANDGGFFFPLGDHTAFHHQIDAVRALSPEERTRRAAQVQLGTWRRGALDLIAAIESKKNR